MSMLRSRSKTLVLLGIYLPYLMFFALAPFTFHRDAALSLIELIGLRFEGMSSVWRVTAWDIWTNILFFLPFGFLFVLLPSIVHIRSMVKILLAAACAALLSIGIEVGQTLLPRQPSIADVACNLLGALLGSVLGIMDYPRLSDLHADGQAGLLTNTSVGMVMLTYWAALCLLFSFPLPLVPDFSNWDPALRLNLGNETTLSRPWRGDLQGVALYDRALSQDEVRTNFSAGPPGAMRTPPVSGGIVARYDFSEGFGTVIHDRAGSSHPVDLRIENPSLVRWIIPKGLAILGSTSISSGSDSAAPLHRRLSVSGEMSLESWLVPADSRQPGPNPFVSSSNKVDLRNFTLAQDAGDLVFWLRTPLTGLNGRKAELRTNHQPLTAVLHHVVITYASRTAALYLNGVEQARLVLDRKQALLDAVVGGIGPSYELGVRSVFFFPLGILSYLSFRKLKTIWIPLVAALAGVGVIEVARVLTLHSPAEGSLIAVSAGTVLVASLVAPSLFAPHASIVSLRTS
jgi:glycopeptide antibiotics resistance protein